MIWAALEAACARPWKSNSFAVLSSGIVYEIDSSSDHFHIPVQLKGESRQKEVVAMIDSGATTKFIHRDFVKENKVLTHKLRKPIMLFNIDGTENRDGRIEEVAILEMIIGTHREKVVFMVTDVGPESVIIGLDWLREHNPDINWVEGSLKLNRCPEKCRARREVPEVHSVRTSDTGVRPTARTRVRKPKVLTKGKVLSKVTTVEDFGFGG